MDEQAFVLLEEYFRNELNEKISNEESNRVIAIHRSNYMNSVIAAAQSLNIVHIKDYTAPSPDLESWSTYSEFDAALKNLLIQIKINNAKRKKAYSVYLRPNEKEKIRFYISQIKEEVTKSQIDLAKKEAIFNKLSALEIEIERDRTRFEIIADVTRRVAGLAGDFEKQGVRPFLKYMFLLLGDIDAAKESEKRSLPTPEEKKQLEPPKRSEAPNPKIRFSSEIDDAPF